MDDLWRDEGRSDRVEWPLETLEAECPGDQADKEHPGPDQH